VTDAALQMYANLVGFREGDKAIEIDIADIAGLSIEDGAPTLRRRRLAAIRQLERASRIGHELVDHKFGFACNSIHDVVDADRAGNVVDEIDQPPHADQREHHGSRHGRDGVRTGAAVCVRRAAPPCSR